MIRSLTRSTFVGALGAGLLTVAVPRVSAPQSNLLRVAAPFADQFAEPFYAEESGAFGRAGFGIDVVALQNAGATVAALAGGSVQLAVGDLVSGVNAILKGIPILLVAGGALYESTTHDNTLILATAKDSPIRQPRDIAGKTIGVPTVVGLLTAALQAWLPANGVAVSSVKLVEIPQSAAVAAIERGTVDVALLGEPNISPYRNDVRDVGHPMDGIAKEFLVSVWYASKPWIEADRARARRAVGAIYDTARWANAHHAMTMALLIREGKLDPDRMHNMIRSPFATSLTPALVQPVFNVATQYKIFDRPVDANTIITKL